MFTYIVFPKWIKPEIIPGFPVRWYALMYIVAFTIAYFFFRYQCKHGALGYMDSDSSSDLFMYVILSLVIGARLFSCLFYEGNTFYWTHPHLILWPFRNGRFTGLPGMSYHGGVIGGIFGAWLYTRKHKYKLLDIMDTVIASVPLAYTFGRIGNFINGELWGRASKTSYGIIFPLAPHFSTSEIWVQKAAEKASINWQALSSINLPRHPSQLYEAFGEGILLFFIVWFGARKISQKKKLGPGFVSGVYLLGYGLIRFIIEFFREPDEQLGFIFLSFSMGQLLCFFMIVTGLVLIVHSYKTQPTVYQIQKTKKTNKTQKTAK